MSFKLAKNRFLNYMIVGLCHTQIGRFSPILTKKITKKKKKSVTKSANFLGQASLSDLLWFGVTYASVIYFDLFVVTESF